MILPFQIKDRAISGGSEITVGNQGNALFYSAYKFYYSALYSRPMMFIEKIYI